MILYHLARSYPIIGQSTTSIHCNEKSGSGFHRLVQVIVTGDRQPIVTAAQWVETLFNRHIQFKDMNLFPVSSGVSERENEGSGARERAQRAVRSVAKE